MCVGDFELSVVASVSKDIFFHGGNICEGSRAWNFNTPPPPMFGILIFLPGGNPEGFVD